MSQFDVVIIGAGPAGAIASALLNKKGYRVCVLEKQVFPRFVIGESLLPHCMEFIEEAGMLEAIKAGISDGFQFKNGAAFSWGNRYTTIDFTDKFSPGPGTTFQVTRARFDHILISEAQKQGVEVRFEHSVESIEFNRQAAVLSVSDPQDKAYQLEAQFVLDASGYGRVLAKLLNLEYPSSLPERMAYFTHIDDNVTDPTFDRNKILICTHPVLRDVWIWFIPFSNNRTSVGVVGQPECLNNYGCEGAKAILKKFVSEVPMLKRILSNAQWDNEVPFRTLRNYSANVKSLYGEHFALLGNASEFLDPVFSSGVTIAMHSAKLAADVLHRQFSGEAVNWQQEYADKLQVGINAFKTYVNGWYSTKFQDVIYAEHNNPEIRRMISSILAGYAWDENNPFVTNSERRLDVLAEICGPAKSC